MSGTFHIFSLGRQERNLSGRVSCAENPATMLGARGDSLTLPLVTEELDRQHEASFNISSIIVLCCIAIFCNSRTYHFSISGSGRVWPWRRKINDLHLTMLSLLLGEPRRRKLSKKQQSSRKPKRKDSSPSPRRLVLERAQAELQDDGQPASSSRSEFRRSQEELEESERSDRAIMSVEKRRSARRRKKSPTSDNPDRSTKDGTLEDDQSTGETTKSGAVNHDHRDQRTNIQTRVSDSHIPSQFPGQTPLEYAQPYHPSTLEHSASYGEAASFYGDQGKSVGRQPGVRPGTPIIVGAEPHLLPASAVSNPPQETGHGAAASYYSGANGSTDQQHQPQTRPSAQTTTMHNPTVTNSSGQHENVSVLHKRHGSSALQASLLGGAIALLQVYQRDPMTVLSTRCRLRLLRHPRGRSAMAHRDHHAGEVRGTNLGLFVAS
ncbi:hypothetical protein MRB53_037032 [Persea americana]|nr:hypothetical protein MRB53_037032 [Persea americana]